MKAIILAGGKATRLPQSAKDIPKALVDVGGKPIIQHQLDRLYEHGFFDIRLALGYRAEQIIEWLDTSQLTANRRQTEGRSKRTSQQSIDYVIEPEPLDTGGAIKFASKDLTEPFMVLNGDILSDVHFKNFSEKFSRYARSPVGGENIKIENIIAAYYTPDARSYGIIKKNKGRVVEFLEKPFDSAQGKPEKSMPGHINAGFYILHPKIFKNITEKKFSIEKNIFPQLATQGKLGYYIHKGFWTDAGTEGRLSEARAYYKNGIL